MRHILIFLLTLSAVCAKAQGGCNPGYVSAQLNGCQVTVKNTITPTPPAPTLKSCYVQWTVFKPNTGYVSGYVNCNCTGSVTFPVPSVAQGATKFSVRRWVQWQLSSGTVLKTTPAVPLPVPSNTCY